MNLSKLGRKSRQAALAIFLITVAIRGSLLWRASSFDFLYGHFRSDGFRSEDEGINVALALARKGEFADPFLQPTGPTAHLPPAYPFVSGAIYRMFGEGYTAAGVRNAINIAGFGLLYASFPAATAALGIGSGAGSIAGFGAAVLMLFRGNEVYRGRDEWAAALLLLWLTVAISRACIGGEYRRGVIFYMVAWGVLLHSQPSTLTVLPLHALIWMRYSPRRPFRERFDRILLATAVIALTLLPWTLRNYMTMGGWFFIRDNLGLEMRVSNADGAQASLIRNLSIGRSWFCGLHPICSKSSIEEIRRVGELDVNRGLMREAVSWIASHPRRFLELTGWRFLAFWADLSSLGITFPLRILCSVAAWTGLAVMWRAGYTLQAALLASVLVAYPMLYYIVQYSSRYVVPISFAIFLPAGFLAERLYTWLRIRKVSTSRHV